MVLHFDTAAAVDDALREGMGRAALAAGGSVEAARAPRLVVVCFADAWAPPAMATASTVQAVRSGGEVGAIANLFVLDAFEERERAWELSVTSTPATFFWWDGHLLPVRRPGWEDDNKICGALAVTQLLEIVRHARSTCGGDGGALALDF